VARVKLSPFTRIAIDDLAVGKGQRYVSIVMALDTGAAIHVAKGKAADSVKPFLQKLEKKGAQIKAVATDMGRAFPSAVTEVFPKALLVYDHEAPGLRIQEHAPFHAQTQDPTHGRVRTYRMTRNQHMTLSPVR
jgi:hypothetical protein